MRFSKAVLFFGSAVAFHPPGVVIRSRRGGRGQVVEATKVEERLDFWSVFFPPPTTPPPPPPAPTEAPPEEEPPLTMTTGIEAWLDSDALLSSETALIAAVKEKARDKLGFVFQVSPRAWRRELAGVIDDVVVGAFLDQAIPRAAKLLDVQWPPFEDVWIRDETAEKWGAEVLKLWTQAQSGKTTTTGRIRDGEVTHLGEDILALGLTESIDADTATGVKAVLLRREQRETAVDAVDAVEAVRKVVVTGAPGTGTTFGTMAAIVGELLRRGSSVVRFSKDPERFVFFRPTNGTTKAWSSASWDAETFADPGLTFVADPTEAVAARLPGLRCRVIQLPAEDTFKDWTTFQGNTAAVLLTNPPSRNELLILCRALWNPRSPRPGQGSSVDDEIAHRALLVGPCPRYIIFWHQFLRRLNDIEDHCGGGGGGGDAKKKRDPLLMTTYTGPRTVDYPMDPWRWREQRRSVMNPLASYRGHHNDLDDDRGEWYFETSMCEEALANGGTFRIGEFTPSSNSSYQQTATTMFEVPKMTLEIADNFAAFARLWLAKNTLLRLPGTLATNLTTWFIPKPEGILTLNITDKLRLLEDLGVVSSRYDYQNKTKTWLSRGKDFRASLYLATYNDTSSDIHLRGNANEIDLFKAHVHLRRLAIATDPIHARSALHRSVQRALVALRLVPQELRRLGDDEERPHDPSISSHGPGGGGQGDNVVGAKNHRYQHPKQKKKQRDLVIFNF